MKSDSDVGQPRAAPALSRRTFLSLGGGALAAWLSACQPAPAVPNEPTERPTGAATEAPTPVPSPTPEPPTATSVPTAAPTAAAPTPTGTESGPQPPLDRAALMAHWPATATSRVVAVRHGGVWDGGVARPEVVLQMLDAGVSALADGADALAVWRALFDPGERVLLKVNCIAAGGPTQPAVAYAVAQRLQDAGLSAERIVIFDRTDWELERAGYALNDGGPGVQCHGERGTGSQVRLSQASVAFYRELEEADAIINLPTPKQHDMAGVSVSLKNHYGSIDQPGALHGRYCDPGIAELNAQPLIRDKTRLIVAAALNVSPFDWDAPEPENALLLSFDPVALDTIGRDILVRHRQAGVSGTDYVIARSVHLRTAQDMGLGTQDPAQIELRELTLG